MRFIASVFLVTVVVGTAFAQKSAAPKEKPSLYNHIWNENDPVDKAVKTAYAARFNIIEIRKREGYTEAKPTTRVSPLPVRNELGRPINGEVYVAFIVASDGRVIEPVVLNSTNKRLTLAAVAAIRQWRFTPARLNGSAISEIWGLPATFEDSTKPSFSLARSLSEAEKKAMFVRTPAPDYPYEARRRKEEGVGLFRLEIDERGKVTNVTILKSTGHQSLDAEGLKAFRAWLARPGERRKFDVPLRFVLSGSRRSDNGMGADGLGIMKSRVR